MSKFKVGQRVRLVDNRHKMDGEFARGWNDSMEKHFGDVVTITEICRDLGRDLDYIRTKENGWSWDLRFLEPVSEYNKGNLKVGQKVRLVSHMPSCSVYGGVGFGMERYLGMEVTITKVETSYFKFKEDVYDYVWDYVFIEEGLNASEKPQSKVYGGLDFIHEDYILPCGYTLTKVIQNGNAVICFVEEDETDNIIKTVAICQEGDAFDLHKGVEICMYKTLRKIADKNLKKF